MWTTAWRRIMKKFTNINMRHIRISFFGRVSTVG